MVVGLKERLIEIADEVGSDAAFARIAKVSRSAVSQWRKGDVRALKALTAINIQEKTGYSARWLVLGLGVKKLQGKQETGVPTHIPQELNREAEKKLLAILRAFFESDDEQKEEIAEAVEAVTEKNGGKRGQTAESKRRRMGAGN